MQIRPTLPELSKLAGEGYTLLPVALSFPWDGVTTVEAFSRLKAGTNQAFLLESAAGGEEVGRYSFMGIEPFAELKCHDGAISWREEGDSWTKPTERPLEDIGEILASFKAPLIENLPPFQGGAVGYVAYDSVRYLERIPLPKLRHASRDARFMFFKTMLAVDRFHHRLHLIGHIRLTTESLENGYQRVKAELETLWNKVTRPRSEALPRFQSFTDLPELPTHSQLGEDRFSKALSQIKKHIRCGDIFQGVLSDSFSFDLQVDPLLVYRALRMINPSPYLFFLHMGDETLLGASPEMLVKAVDGEIRSCPIAGTRPRGQTRAEDEKLARQLYASVKEKAEHLMLVDLGRNDIGRVAELGSVQVEDFMHIERYSHVMHLVTNVVGKLKRRLSAWDAFCSCFPAGTLTGAPKIRAMEIISDLEDKCRGPYGGAVVYHDFAGNLNSCITIRSLYVRDKKGYLQAGAGIVADSIAKREYEEIRNKAKAVKTAVRAALAVKGGPQ